MDAGADERPAALRHGSAAGAGAELAEKLRRAGSEIALRAGAAFALRREEAAQRVKGVVGDHALPGELPERIAGFAGKSTSGGLMDRGKKRGAVAGQKFR